MTDAPHIKTDISAKAFGALDIGGTKIEAALFDERLEPVAKHRIDTPKGSYEAFLQAIESQVGWLREKSGDDLGVGICTPGVVNPTTGTIFTANLPASGHPLSADLTARLGQPVPVENDASCFTLSEANGGAGDGYQTVFGLILGTGVGGGVAIDGSLHMGLNGLPGELGHSALPAHLAQKYDLPIVRCGCGRMGCYETLVAGPGLTRLAAHVSGEAASTNEIAERAAKGDPQMQRVMAIWADIAGELIHMIQLAIDPDIIVLGGGLSRIPGVEEQLLAGFEPVKLPGMLSLRIAVAKYGDASGARGAAILAARAI